MKTRVVALVIGCWFVGCNFNDQREPPRGPDDQRTSRDSARRRHGSGEPPSSDAEPGPNEGEPDAPSGQDGQGHATGGADSDDAGATSSTDDDPGVPTQDNGTVTDTGTEAGTGTDTSTDPSVHVTFAEIKRRVFDPYCAMCHEGPGAGEGVDVSNLDGLIAGTSVLGDDNSAPPGRTLVPGNCEESVLWKAVVSGRMPYFSDPLPEEETKLLRAWIEGGAEP